MHCKKNLLRLSTALRHCEKNVLTLAILLQLLGQREWSVEPVLTDDKLLRLPPRFTFTSFRLDDEDLGSI
jgi:hypothetical protein